MKNKGTILSLQLCPGYRKPMQTIEEAEAMVNLGFKNDTHAIRDSARQVLLIEKETLDALHLDVGIVKENITTENIELMSLPSGSMLKVGNDVFLKITKSCSPCSRLEEIREGLKREIAGKRGMLAQVVAGGIIRRGDTIEVVGQ